MTYEGSENTRQIIHTGDRLIMLAGSSQVAIQMRRGETDPPARRIVMAADPETGEMLWRKDVSIDTLLPLVVFGRFSAVPDQRAPCLSGTRDRARSDGGRPIRRILPPRATARGSGRRPR